MKRLRRAVGVRVLCLLVAWAVLGASARAAFAESDTRAVLPNVDVAVVGRAMNLDTLLRQVVSWFEGVGTPTHTTRLDRIDSSAVFAATDVPGVRVWILIPTPWSARVFFAVQEGQGRPPRYLVTDVLLDRGLDEPGMEQIAQVVYLSATALWAGTVESSEQDVEERLRVGVSPEPRITPVAASAPTPRRTDKPKLELGAGLEYAWRAQGDEGVAQGPGAEASLRFKGRAGDVGVALRADAILPHEPERSGVELNILGASVVLAAVAVHPISKALAVAAELGPGLDLVRYRIESLDNASLRADAGRFDARPTFHFAIGPEVELGAVHVSVFGGVVVQCLHTHYDVVLDDHRSRVIVPSLVQPGLVARVSW